MAVSNGGVLFSSFLTGGGEVVAANPARGADALEVTGSIHHAKAPASPNQLNGGNAPGLDRPDDSAPFLEEKRRVAGKLAGLGNRLSRVEERLSIY